MITLTADQRVILLHGQGACPGKLRKGTEEATRTPARRRRGVVEPKVSRLPAVYRQDTG
ncbi:hypothetical protein O9H85_28310 [Paenibacillus filicis]|uniref:Transposase n=1 Tax=Paenibacillus gyeongsangnamensis TaxID=3388067 RepID=A0ABT4QH67_9BACL|nr:hypothetical protein [Paenibacillus filicis]MCZ8516229.1 hypothetical protein [Paenibacillus filicis]